MFFDLDGVKRWLGLTFDAGQRSVVQGVLRLSPTAYSIRVQAALQTSHVRVHVQTTPNYDPAAHVGGTYAGDNPLPFQGTTEAGRMQDVALTVTAGTVYHVFLIPTAYPSGAEMRYDGESGRPDYMTRLTIAAEAYALDRANHTGTQQPDSIEGGAPGRVLRDTGAEGAWSSLAIPDTVTTGDILVASEPDFLEALAIGGAGTVLASVGGGPTWTGSPALAGSLSVTSNLSVGASPSYGGGARVLYVAPATTAPTSAPSSGFLLYHDPGDGFVKVWKAGEAAPFNIG